ncbi:hypothetical protein [Bacillus cereus]|uniref:hypothetical protein n=1 Tax=Bacillus cereus TaxID=1396 RepID=UPI001F5FFA90|nr:hypothetical protein [Bacillus cereus]
MNQNTKIVTTWMDNMLEREIAINKLLEAEVTMLNSLLNTENETTDILTFQNLTISLMGCLYNTNTMSINTLELIIHRNYLTRD